LDALEGAFDVQGGSEVDLLCPSAHLTQREMAPATDSAIARASWSASAPEAATSTSERRTVVTRYPEWPTMSLGGRSAKWSVITASRVGNPAGTVRWRWRYGIPTLRHNLRLCCTSFPTGSGQTELPTQTMYQSCWSSASTGVAVDELIAAYRAGATKHELAKRYKIGRTSVYDLLRRYKIESRSK
jgi:hypothetical protein